MRFGLQGGIATARMPWQLPSTYPSLTVFEQTQVAWADGIGLTTSRAVEGLHGDGRAAGSTEADFYGRLLTSLASCSENSVTERGRATLEAVAVDARHLLMRLAAQDAARRDDDRGDRNGLREAPELQKVVEYGGRCESARQARVTRRPRPVKLPPRPCLREERKFVR